MLRCLGPTLIATMLLVGCGGSPSAPAVSKPPAGEPPATQPATPVAAPAAGNIVPLRPLPPIPTVPAPAPAALVATLHTASAFAALDDAATYLEHIEPGLGSILWKADELVEALLHRRHVDLSGVDLVRAMRVLLLAPSEYEQPWVVIVPVADEHALMALVTSLGLHVQLHDGHAAIGSHQALTTAGAYALTTLLATPAPVAPTLDLDLGRAGPAALVPRLASPASLATLAGFGRLLERDGDRAQAVVHLDEGQLTVTLRVTPRAGTGLASFVAAQAPASFAMLERIGAGDFTLGGRIDLAPVWDAIGPLVEAQLRATGHSDDAMAFRRWMAAPPGELGAAAGFEVGSMGLSTLLAPSDPSLVRAVLEAPRLPADDELAGRTKATESTERHRGHTLHVTTVTATESATTDMTTYLPLLGGSVTTASAVVGKLAVFTAGARAVERARVLVDLAAGRGKKPVALAPARAAVLAEARRRRESLLVTWDLPTSVRLAGMPWPATPGEPAVLAMGVDGGALTLRLSLPASQLRPFAAIGAAMP